MSEGWSLVPLGEAAVPVTRPEVPITGKTYRQVGVRLWGEGAYERETIDGSQTKYATLSRIEADDIIVNKIWARNGSVAVVPPLLAGCYCSGEFPTFAPIATKLHPRWFYWLTKTKGFWEQCDEKSRGTSGQNRIKPEQFLRIQMPLPPLPEQRRIVARIDELAAKVEEAKGLRREAMEEVDAFTLSLHIRLSGTRTVCMTDILRLHEDKVEVRHGQSYPQVGVKGFGQGLFARETLEANQTTYRTFNRLYAGGVVLSQVKGWEGAIAVCPTDLAGRYVSPEYRTFQCIPGEADPRYLSAIVTTPWFWSRLKDATRGVGARRERTRPEQFLNINIPMPTHEQQVQAINLFRQTDVLKALQGETAAELSALLPSVLDRAFSGRL